MEILRIKTQGKSKEFLQVLADFRKDINDNPRTCRSHITCFMKGMFFYDKPDYQYITIETFHKLSVENRLDLEDKEYILIKYKD